MKITGSPCNADNRTPERQLPATRNDQVLAQALRLVLRNPNRLGGMENDRPDAGTTDRITAIVRQQMTDQMLYSLLEARGRENLALALVDSLPAAAQKTQEAQATLDGNRYDDIIDQTARSFGIEADLVRAVIKAESDFDAGSLSPKGAMGLMQLMPETASDLSVKNPFDPVENITGGTRYLKMLLDRYNGDTSSALAAYNWGMGNLDRNPDRLPAETKTYVSRVNSYYLEYSSKSSSV